MIKSGDRAAKISVPVPVTVGLSPNIKFIEYSFLEPVFVIFHYLDGLRTIFLNQMPGTFTRGRT